MPDTRGPEEIKIILNGGISGSVLSEICSVIYDFTESGGRFPDAPKLVKLANEIENRVFEFGKEVLRQQGFNGPWPKSMS